MPRRPLVLLVVLAAALAAAPSVAPAGATTAGDRAAHWGLAQAGTHEVGTTNCSATIDRWVRHMGLRVPPCRPWCGAFVHEAFLRAGVRLSARLIDPDRSYRDAVAGRRGLRRIAIGSVRRGDILFYAIRPGLLASHLAIVTRRLGHNRVRTVEGNNAHAVRVETRSLRLAVLAARVAA